MFVSVVRCVLSSFILVWSFSPAFAAQRPDGAQFKSGEIGLVYYDKGPRDATPLVVIAGGPGFDHKYLYIGGAFDAISKSNRVVFYDQRGTGGADAFAPRDSITVADYIADIEALRLALGADLIDVLGHSFGGYLAMGYALKYPGRTRRLVLVDSVAPRRAATSFIFSEAFPERMEMYRAWNAAVAKQDVLAATQQVTVYLSTLFYDPAKGETWRKAASSVGYNPIPSVLWDEARGPDLTSTIPGLTLPVLVLTGRYDMNVSARSAWEIHRALPKSEFMVFERSGHLPFFEEPDLFARTVIKFLSN